MTGRFAGVSVGFRETRMEEVEEMCKFMKILLCYADVKREDILLA